MICEIVHVQVGQCAHLIGIAVWNAMNIDGKFARNKDNADNQRRLDEIDAYFKQAGELRFVPHAALIHSEVGSLDTIKASAIDTMGKPDNLLIGASGADSNWTKVHYTEGAKLIDGVVDVIIKGSESYDCPQGFEIKHSQNSLGGGTDSELATLLLMKIINNYCDRFRATFSVYPSPKVSDVVVEANKTTLSIHQFLENGNETFVIDKEVSYNISLDILKAQQAKYAQLNWVTSLVILMSSGIAALLILNGDLRKMGIKMTFFFFAIAQSPLFVSGDAKHVKVTVQEKTHEMQ